MSSMRTPLVTDLDTNNESEYFHGKGCKLIGVS
jgi:hypothetical protein